jgi:hypothetical protein
MDDIDKDIERARIGKKREELHEVIRKKKLPLGTNLKSQRAINQQIKQKLQEEGENPGKFQKLPKTNPPY